MEVTLQETCYTTITVPDDCTDVENYVHSHIYFPSESIDDTYSMVTPPYYGKQECPDWQSLMVTIKYSKNGCTSCIQGT